MAYSQLKLDVNQSFLIYIKNLFICKLKEELLCL